MDGRNLRPHRGRHRRWSWCHTGIALALADSGATVYFTGQSRQERDSDLPDTVFATAKEVTRCGGTRIPAVCDHADDEQVRELFCWVEREHGRIDLLVNNAFTVPAGLTDDGPFRMKPARPAGDVPGRIEADVIVFATGYKRFPFFADAELQPDADRWLPLFKRIRQARNRQPLLCGPCSGPRRS